MQSKEPVQRATTTVGRSVRVFNQHEWQLDRHSCQLWSQAPSVTHGKALLETLWSIHSQRRRMLHQVNLVGQKHSLTPHVPRITQTKGSLTWADVMSSCLRRKQAAACLWCKTELLPRFKAKVWVSFESYHGGTPHQRGFPHNAGLDHLQSPFFQI